MATDLPGAVQVGEFSNVYLNNRRRLIRAVQNPLDKCTVVSIYPKRIEEIKVTIEPGRFVIEPGTYEKPSTLVVGSSSWWKDVDIEQPMLEIPCSSIQVADSIVKDYCKGIFGCNMGDAMPGLFYVMGAVEVDKIKTQYSIELDKAKKRQDEWFKILVMVADSLWARTNGNPRTISDEMRMAANALNKKDKLWLQDFEAPELKPCKACGGLRNPLFPICPTCKTIDMAHPLAKDLKFAV